ncbi:MAG: DMT family transporter [Gemmatimonadaceae bacterium]
MRDTSRAALLRGTLAVVISACCFGSISPLTVVATERGMALQSIQAWRYAASAMVLLAVAWWRPPARPRDAIPPWFTPQVLALAGSGQALVATLARAALRWLPTATASFLFYTYPAWVTIIGALRGHEPLDRIRVTALLLALGGIGAMVGAPDAASLHPIGLALILGGALAYALYIPLLDHLQRPRDPLDVSRAIAVGGSAIFCLWAGVTGTLFAIPDVVAFGASVLQGVLSAGSFIGFLAGLRVLGPVRTAITSTVEPFWTTLLGVVLLGQSIGVGTIVGGVAIMGAVLLLQRPVAGPGARASSSVPS